MSNTTESPTPVLTPMEVRETPVMTVWPTIGAMAAGRWVGRLAAVKVGAGRFFTAGKLLALATIPVTLCVFFWQLMPRVCRRYALTSRRVVVQKGLQPADERSVRLDEFDAIEVAVLPGQDWLHAGELIFRREGTEVFRLSGVSRPEVFRQVCLKARTALVSVRELLQQQAIAKA